MSRIRGALALVSLATLGLVALLAWRANQGLAAERAVRHEAVAERAFEEMERVLTDFLNREEARPFEHYAHTLPATGERSPLAGPLEPFVVGGFQVDFQGSVTTPLEPVVKNEMQAAHAGAVAHSASRVRDVVDGLWSANQTDGKDDSLPSPLGKGASQREAERFAKKESGIGDEQPKGGRFDQAPGTTRVVSGPGLGSRDESADADAAEANEEAQNTFDVLERLNRAVDYRAERKQKVAEAPKAVLYPDAEPRLAQVRTPARPGERSPLADAESESDEGFLEEAAAGQIVARGASPPPPAEAPMATAPSRRLDRLADAGAALDAPAAVTVDVERSSRQRDAVRVAIDPMVGIAVGGELVLYRTVLVGQHGYRQGLVLDREALGAWLEERVIRSSGLAEVASVTFGEARRPAVDRYVYAHRFAEPFDAVEARLALASLPGVASPVALYALVVVLLAVGAAGLYAVHRTVSLAVGYAERRNNFVAAVSHELKTPLTAIRMYAEMLRDGLVSDDAKRQDYYATITDESERLSRLVDNVLEFSELEGGRGDLAIRVGLVGPVLEEAAEKLAAHAAREGFTIHVAVAPDLPAVRFDRDALLQVLFNLVDNAMKYARAADPKRVELEAKREGDTVTVAVRDYGPGVSRTHLDHIFEPFYRAESELTRVTKGTGIGLALVKGLAGRMGAAVSGANAESGGFRVCLEFPRAMA